MPNAIENHTTTIEFLSLSSNKLITDSSIDIFLQMIKHNQSLKTLIVFDCNFIEKDRKTEKN
jgi:hypothetical protein